MVSWPPSSTPKTLMPDPTRLDVLRDLHAKDPGDPFLAYGLAMELAKTPATVAAAGSTFAALLARRPDYVPAYYQYGLLLERQGRTEEARRVLAQGIEAAGRAGDLHARGELEAALAAL